MAPYIIKLDKALSCILPGTFGIHVSGIILLFIMDDVVHHPDLPFSIDVFMSPPSKCIATDTSQLNSALAIVPAEMNCNAPDYTVSQWVTHIQNWSLWRYKLVIIAFFFSQFGISLKYHLSSRAPCGTGWVLCCNFITIQLLSNPASITPSQVLFLEILSSKLLADRYLFQSLFAQISIKDINAHITKLRLIKDKYVNWNLNPD